MPRTPKNQNKIAEPKDDSSPISEPEDKCCCGDEREKCCGRKIIPLLLMFAIGIVVGLLLYCFIFGCGCPQDDTQQVVITMPNGDVVIFQAGPGGTTTTDQDGNTLDCAISCTKTGGAAGASPGGTNSGGANGSSSSGTSPGAAAAGQQGGSNTSTPGAAQSGTGIFTSPPATQNGNGSLAGPSMPDYTITELDVICGPQYNTIKATMVNQGAGEAPFYLGDGLSIVNVNGPGEPFASDHFSIYNTPLENTCPGYRSPGGTCTISINYANALGSINTACADVGGVIAESDEGNNCMEKIAGCPAAQSPPGGVLCSAYPLCNGVCTGQDGMAGVCAPDAVSEECMCEVGIVPVEGGQMLPDLALDYAAAGCDPLTGLGNIRIWVRNGGDSEIPSTTIAKSALFVDGTNAGDTLLSDMNSFCNFFSAHSSYCEFQANPVYLPVSMAGDRHVQVCMDRYDDILESDESNNCIELQSVCFVANEPQPPPPEEEGTPACKQVDMQCRLTSECCEELHCCYGTCSTRTCD